MLIRREHHADIDRIRSVHQSAFADAAPPGGDPAEPGLVDSLRAGQEWIPRLSLVAAVDDEVLGHVACTRGWVGEVPALGLGPIGVYAEHQGRGVGSALMHAVLSAADAMDEPLIALLGHTDYYPRFGFHLAEVYNIQPPVSDWAPYFQVRPLTAYRPAIQGEFTYAKPFMEL